MDGSISSSSNGRPIAIFASYLALNVSLVIRILCSLRLKGSMARTRRGAVCFFASLTVFSLAVTWFYMITFFIASYKAWELRVDSVLNRERVSGLRIGDWLHDTKLFREAWESTVVTVERWWWSQQIFLGACAWAIFLAVEGHRRRIRHLWMYMLVGQLIAMSFAVNLFFLAVLLHKKAPPATPRDPTDVQKKSAQIPLWIKHSHTIAIMVTFVAIYFIPSAANTSTFLPVMLLPHFLLFLPCISSEFFYPDSAMSLRHHYAYWRDLFRLISIGSIISHATAWYQVTKERSWEESFRNILRALYAHPAVSSVGWDVILVGLSVAFWTSSRRVLVLKSDMLRSFFVIVFNIAYLFAGSLGLIAVGFSTELIY